MKALLSLHWFEIVVGLSSDGEVSSNTYNVMKMFEVITTFS